MKRFLFIISVISLGLLGGAVLQPVAAISEEDLRAVNLGAPLYYGGNIGVCLGGGAANLQVGINFSLGPIENGEQRRVNLIRALANDLNLSPEQAAGIVGNFMAESGGDNLPPNYNEILNMSGDGEGPPREVIPGTNTGGYGWAQWTGGRKTAFINYSIENGYVESANVDFNDAANYAYLIHELTQTSESSVVDSLRRVSTPEDAAVTFMREYERPGVLATERRENGARQSFDEYSSGPVDPGDTARNACAGGPNSAAISGDYAFPLLTTKSAISNNQIFRDGDTDLYGHDYTAYDILVPEGTPVVAFIEGTVINVGRDRCPGRSIAIYNEEDDLTVSYLHLSFNDHIQLGDTVMPGDYVGLVGSDAEGCTIAHLHLDVVTGQGRPGCRRGACDAASRFVRVGEPLYETYQLLAD